MKQLFQTHEVVEFLKKRRDEMVADEIISRTIVPDILEMPTLEFVDGVEMVFKAGYAKGKIEAQMTFINQLIDFFEM